MSSFFPEHDVEVVKIVLNRRDASDTVTYYFAQDYWPENSLYSGSPEIYPLLTSSPTIHRGFGRPAWAGIKFDVSIELHAKTSLVDRGVSFADQLEIYELHGATVTLLYYVRTLDAATVHLDSVNKRQVVYAIGSGYDDGESGNTGRLTIRCKDVFMRTKEISQKFDLDTFPDMDAKYDGEYGGIVFGESTTAGQGVLIDAPFISSSLSGGTKPVAKIFSGFTFPSHPNAAFERLLVRNQHRDQDDSEWLEVALESDPQTAAYGDASASSLIEPANYPLDLSRFARAIVDSPTTNATKILTAVRAGLQANTAVRCADMIDGQHFWNSNNPSYLSANDPDFTAELWVRFDALHDGSFNRIICRQGAVWTSDLEWQCYFNTSTDAVRFGISNDGTTISDTVAWSSTASTATWYHVVLRCNGTSDAIGITVNNGTEVTTATGGDAPSRLEGAFMIGSNNSSDPGFDGRIKTFRYWRRVLTNGEVTTLYNSGTPLSFVVLSDSIRKDLRCAYDFDEPIGIRADANGSADLTPASASSILSPVISYNYSTITVTPDNSAGKTSVSVSHAESLDSGATYNPVGSPLREATIDITTSAIQSGTSNSYFQIDPPLVKAPDANYMTVLDFSNTSTNIYYPRCAYEPDVGSTHYAKDKRADLSNWSLQSDTLFDMQFYYLGEGDDAWEDGTTTGDVRYSYYDLEAKQITLSNGQAHKEFNTGLEFKIAISGIEDDSSGTYTGTPNAIISNPADIIRFVLMSPYLMGLDATSVDTSSFDAARTALAAMAIKQQIVINSKTEAEQFIYTVCQQARLVFYKTREGKLAVKFPTPIDNTFTATLSQGLLQGEMQVVGVADNDYSQVVNSFRQYYQPDILNQPTDPSLLRRDAREKLAGKLEINPDSSTANDAFREGLCADSQEKYGEREIVFDLSYYDSADSAQKIQNYYCDRFSSLQRAFTLRLPRRSYYNTIELFSTIKAQHAAIPSSTGSAMPARQHHSNTPIVTYSDGIRSLVWSGGNIEGQVTEIQESGPWIYVTAETVSIF